MGELFIHVLPLLALPLEYIKELSDDDSAPKSMYFMCVLCGDNSLVEPLPLKGS